MATSSWSWTEDEPFKWAWAVQFATGPSRHTTERLSAHLHGQLSSVTLGLVWLCLFMSPKTWLHWARPPSPCGQGGSSGWLGSRPQLLWEVILTCISAHPLYYIANSKDMLTLIFTWYVCVCVCESRKGACVYTNIWTLAFRQKLHRYRHQVLPAWRISVTIW